MTGEEPDPSPLKINTPSSWCVTHGKPHPKDDVLSDIVVSPIQPVSDGACLHSDNVQTDEMGVDKVGAFHIPLFAQENENFDCVNNELLFTSPELPSGNVIEVRRLCAYGRCSCEYDLEGVRAQLLPCRFAYLLYGGFFTDPTNHEEVFKGVCEGFKIVSSEIQPYECQNYASILSDKSKPIMDPLVARELAEGFISISQAKPTCVHALGAVPKGEDSIRPITDCSLPLGVAVNDHSTHLAQNFRYNTIHDVVALISPGSYMSVVDIQSAYRAVPVFPKHRSYLGFRWELVDGGHYYVDNRLCFGVTTGPFYFHSISCFISEILQARLGVVIVRYLDDYIIITDTFEGTLTGQLLTIRLLGYLGFHVAWKKISSPSRVTTYLGVEINTEKMCLTLPVEKVVKFKSFVEKYLHCEFISKKELEQLNGLLSHCSQIIQGDRIFTCRCFDMYKQVVHRRSRRIRISSGMHEDLKWWSDFAPFFDGLTCIPHTSHPTPIWTDSSLRGFGAIFGKCWLAGSWDNIHEWQQNQSPCGHFESPPSMTVEDKKNINVLELWAVVVAMEHWAPQLENFAIQLYSDNQQVVYMLLNSCSINTQCMAWLRRLFWLTMRYNVKIIPSYVRSEENVAADAPSRISYCTEISKLHDKLEIYDLCCYKMLVEFVNSRCCQIGSGGD